MLSIFKVAFRGKIHRPELAVRFQRLRIYSPAARKVARKLMLPVKVATDNPPMPAIRIRVSRQFGFNLPFPGLAIL